MASRTRTLIGVFLLTLIGGGEFVRRNRAWSAAKHRKAEHQEAEPILSALSNPAFKWDSVSTPAFSVYFPQGTWAAAHAAELRAGVDSAITHDLAILGEKAYPAHLKVFYVSSRNEVNTITGMQGMGIARASQHSVALVATQADRPANKHEIMHALSLILWGQPGRQGDSREPRDESDAGWFYRGGWLREGLAAAAEGDFARCTLRGVVAQMQAEGDAIPLDTLNAAFYMKDQVSAYYQGATLVKFLLETYGLERFKRLWREGSDSIAATYGKPAATIEAEWRDWLKATPKAERPASMAVVRGPGCG